MGSKLKIWLMMMVALFLLLSLAATVNALINAENESNTDIKFVQRKLRGHTIPPAKGDTNGGQKIFITGNIGFSTDFQNGASTAFVGGKKGDVTMPPLCIRINSFAGGCTSDCTTEGRILCITPNQPCVGKGHRNQD